MPPRNGRYRFQIWSDDGSAIFLGNPAVAVVPLDRSEVPKAKRAALLGETFRSLDERRWLPVEGRAGFAVQTGKGVKLDLGVGRHVISVTVADAHGLDLSALQNARIRVTGLGRGVTRGIFVQLSGLSKAALAFGEMWEVEGRSGAGNFAPTVIADKLTRLGEGLLPSPVTPTWAELLNGSRDVQQAELRGLVTGIHSNTLSLHMPEGRLDVELQGGFEAALKPLLDCVVRADDTTHVVWR